VEDIYKRRMKNICLLILMVLPCFLFPQATFIIESLPANTPPQDQIYIAGDFNEWNPGDPEYALLKNEYQKWYYTSVEVPEGTHILYKFTRGSWETVEKGPNGEEIADRQFTFGNGDTVDIIIYNWAQGGGGSSTAADNVIVMDENFEMPQLGRTRRIWLYLPPDYETSGLDYPVLFMHDGQNLFDDMTSFAGEWQVDETLNDFYQEGIHVPIVVGIDNGGGDFRIDEYSPWVHPMHGGGEGELYMAFIIETLKPYIDMNYRTMTDREHTGIMGSSLGGLISHFGSLANQEIFSKAGIYSPSYWFSDSVWAFTSHEGRQETMRIYMMCGGAEGQSTINNMIAMQDSLLAVGFYEDEISMTVIPGGGHNEQLWRGDFGDAYKWLFSDYAFGIQEAGKINIISFFPNPVNNILTIPDDFPEKCDSLEVIDMMGRQVINVAPFSGEEIDISDLAPGLYLVSLSGSGIYYQGKVLKK
jgi:predicted alpha/beta superfamily hydrolase